MKNDILKFKNFGFLIAILIFAFLILNLNVAYADNGLVPCGEEGNPCTVCHLFVGIKNIIDFLLKSIVFPLAIIALLYGGIMWIIAGGDEQKITKGKNAIKYAIYGIIFAFAGWIIIDTILKGLVDPGQIGKFWSKLEGC